MPSQTPDTIAALQDHGAMEALVPEWQGLFAEAAVRNPFAHPIYLTTWARHFVPPSMLHVVTVRDAGGKLLGVAPFYRFRRPLLPGLEVTQLRLLGTGHHHVLTELPQIVTCPDPKRRILRQILRLVSEEADGWDWAEVSLTPDQGWIEPDWLWQDREQQAHTVVRKATRTGVVLPLPSSWDELRHSLKRNIKESIRRGRNRLARAGYVWEVVVPDGASAVSRALDELMELHHRRAQLRGREHHPDYLADPLDRAFLQEVGQRMFAAGLGMPYLLTVGGVPVAARLLLRANQTTFFSVSGLDPAWWKYSVGTMLMAEGLKAAMGHGDTLAHLSLGPDLAKHRWSEQLEFHNDFILLGRRRRSRLAFRLYWKLRTAARQAGDG